MTEEKRDGEEPRRDRFWWLDLPDLIEMIDAFVRLAWLMLRALWWLLGLIVKPRSD